MFDRSSFAGQATMRLVDESVCQVRTPDVLCCAIVCCDVTDSTEARDGRARSPTRGGSLGVPPDTCASAKPSPEVWSRLGRARPGSIRPALDLKAKHCCGKRYRWSPCLSKSELWEADSGPISGDPSDFGPVFPAPVVDHQHNFPRAGPEARSMLRRGARTCPQPTKEQD